MLTGDYHRLMLELLVNSTLAASHMPSYDISGYHESLRAVTQLGIMRSLRTYNRAPSTFGREKALMAS